MFCRYLYNLKIFAISDLFFNTPARRKFLRTEKTEFSHLDDVVKRISLSRFDVDISLRHNQRVVKALRAANSQLEQEKRIADILGPAFIEQAVHMDFEYEGLRLWGWIAQPTFSRSQAKSSLNSPPRTWEDKPGISRLIFSQSWFDTRLPKA